MLQRLLLEHLVDGLEIGWQREDERIQNSMGNCKLYQ